MALIPSTSPLYGTQGLLGGLLFRTVGNKTVVSTHQPASRKKQSELQRHNRNKFAQASRYAKEALRDPARREYYTKQAKKLKVTSAYTAAITDFMRKGKIEHIDTSKYTKKGTITIKARKKDLDLAEITVRITTPQGHQLAYGPAVRTSTGVWTYRHPGNAQQHQTANITVEAKDRAGNIVTTSQYTAQTTAKAQLTHTV